MSISLIPIILNMINSILIDSRQPHAFQHQIQNAYTEATVEMLPFGDLQIELDSGKLVLIEVKETPNDYLASITDRRLFRQSEGMRLITPWSFLLLSQDFDYDTNNLIRGMSSNGYGVLGTWSRSHIEGSLCAVQARGVMVRVAFNGYVEAIRLICNWVESADNGAITTETIKLSPFDKDSQETVNLLAWFHGIGVLQAKSFLKWANKDGILPNWKILELATSFFDGLDKPVGWTNRTIERNREQMGYPKTLEKPKKKEFLEELDLI